MLSWSERLRCSTRNYAISRRMRRSSCCRAVSWRPNHYRTAPLKSLDDVELWTPITAFNLISQLVKNMKYVLVWNDILLCVVQGVPKVRGDTSLPCNFHGLHSIEQIWNFSNITKSNLTNKIKEISIWFKFIKLYILKVKMSYLLNLIHNPKILYFKVKCFV